MQKYGKFTVEGTFDFKNDGVNTWVNHPSLGEDMWFMLGKTNVFEELPEPEPIKFEDGQIYISRMDSNAVFKRVDGWWMSRYLPADYSSESKVSDDTMRKWVVNGGVLPL